MAILTDFVIAPEAEAKAVLAQPSPTRRWPGVEAKSIDIIRLASLKFILDGQALDDNAVVSYSERFIFLASSADDESHVVRVPSELIEALSKLPNDKVRPIASAWLQTDEFQMDGWWKEEDLFEVVSRLRSLAVEASTGTVPVLLRWSL